MTTMIQENEYGYLIKNGKFQRLLAPGKYRFPQSFGYTILIETAEGEVNLHGLPRQVLQNDAEFTAQTTKVQVPDDSIALHYVDGLFSGVLLKSREYLFWNRYHEHTFQLINLNSPQVDSELPRFIFTYLPQDLYRKITVEHGETALLYFDGKLETTLEPGIYYFWNWNVKVTHKRYELKAQQLEINGQEILTADKVGVRLNVVTRYRITDPVKMEASICDLPSQLYTLVQLTIREHVGRFRLDELLDQKETIGQTILTRLQEAQDSYYVSFLSAGLKDIILPGEMKTIMNTVLIAEKTAQANAITRREEVASTRSLLNTAKLMDENKTLYKLKELEYLERICDRVDHISLSGSDSILRQLSQLTGTR